jgi:hypothetical protein
MSDSMYGRLSTRSGTTEQYVVRLEQVPRWIEQEPLSPSASQSESEASDRGFVDPLTSLSGSFCLVFGLMLVIAVLNLV